MRLKPAKRRKRAYATSQEKPKMPHASRLSRRCSRNQRSFSAASTSPRWTPKRNEPQRPPQQNRSALILEVPSCAQKDKTKPIYPVKLLAMEEDNKPANGGNIETSNGEESNGEESHGEESHGGE
ncbi:hypothetical protein XA68_16421 [Ophiocordyceps unilateralis]|uniref:Uncharacterized protein n=1 Tax=Ophiocordyceps unilateralis TaxID=268505 RepID=A0A2A9P6H4_OPHUN|nr:hypothetical protein XA68_16421 [Ophiocordyceps unilateralis]